MPSDADPPRPARRGRRPLWRPSRAGAVARRRHGRPLDLRRTRAPVADRGLAAAGPWAAARRPAADLVALDPGATRGLLRGDPGALDPRAARPPDVTRGDRRHRRQVRSHPTRP